MEKNKSEIVYTGLIIVSIILVIMLFFGIFSLSNMEGGTLLMFVVLAFASLLFIILLEMGKDETGACYFGMIIGSLILFVMLLWGFFKANSEFEMMGALAMVFIGTFLFIEGLGNLKKHEEGAGRYGVITGGVISLFALSFGILSIMDLVYVGAMILLGFILIIKGLD